MSVLTVINRLSSLVLIGLLIFVGIILTFRTRFVQLRCLPDGLKLIFAPSFSKTKNGISQFLALATGVGTQIGVGNIIGVAVALTIGGAGSVFWMWVSAFFGMSTAYCETVWAQRTKIVKEGGGFNCGPILYVKRAYRGKTGEYLAFIFALGAMLVFGMSGMLVQSKVACDTINEGFGVNHYIVGAVLCSVLLYVNFGGRKRVFSLMGKLVSFMTAAFLIFCIIVLFLNAKNLLSALSLIFSQAFKSPSIEGGGIGLLIVNTVGEGIKKGLFSNEAGLGTAPHIHGGVEVEKPHDQGIVAMIGVFIDSFVVLTITALVIIVCNLDSFETCNYASLCGDTLMLNSFTTAFGPSVAKVVVSLSILLFSVSSVIGWNYIGRLNARYLFKGKGEIIFTAFSLVFIFFASVFSSEFVWAVADLFNAFLVIPNILALFKLSNQRNTAPYCAI